MFSTKSMSVHFNGKKIFTCPGRIINTIEYKDNLIVLYDPRQMEWKERTQEEFSQNIICLDTQGNLVWRVCLPQQCPGAGYNPCFSSLILNEDKKLDAFAECFSYTIDLESGKFLDYYFTK